MSGCATEFVSKASKGVKGSIAVGGSGAALLVAMWQFGIQPLDAKVEKLEDELKETRIELKVIAAKNETYMDLIGNLYD